MMIGWSVSNSLRIYMYKTIEATSREFAEMHFNDLQSLITKIGDTLEATIQTPMNSKRLNYSHCSLSIEIPYEMHCPISNANGPIFID